MNGEGWGGERGMSSPPRAAKCFLTPFRNQKRVPTPFLILFPFLTPF